MKKRVLIIMCMLMALFMPAMDMTADVAYAAVTPAVVELSDTEIVIDLAEGTKYTLKAEVLPEDASQRVSWSTSSSSIVKVSSSGVLTARKRGTATITATARGTKVKATCTVTVIDSDVPDSIEIGAQTLTMNRFDTRQLTPVVSPSTAVQKVKWKTSRSSVVKVSSDGLLTARKAGTATITCYSAEDKTVLDTVTVTVKQQTAPKSISLTPDTDIMVVGQTLQLNAQQYPADACGYFEWRTSSSSRAKVSDDGVVTARKTGWVTITCRSMQSSRIQATRKILIVSESSPHKINAGAESLTLNPGNTYQLSPTVLPAGKDSRVTYKTSRSSVATVSPTGLITVKKAGTAKITITSRANKEVTATVSINAVNLPAPDSMAITAPSAVVNKGGELQLSITPYPSGTNTEVKWSTSSSSIARVSDSGVVTGRKAGKVTITATSKWDKKVKATFEVSVYDPASPTSIQLNAGVITMEVGEKRRMQATVNPVGCKNDKLKWRSTSSSVAKVSSSGEITARKAGSAVISATSTYNTSIAGNVMVTVVSRSAPSSIRLTVPDAQMPIGGTMQLTAAPSPTNASRLFKYESSNSKIIGIDENGLMTAKKAGTVTITVKSAKSSSVKQTITIRAYDPSAPTSVTLNTYSLYLGEDDTATLTATVKPDDTLKTVTWKSSNPSVVKVGSDGRVTAVKAGTATITCTTVKGELTAKCTVTVLDTTLSVTIPERTTDIGGIAGNLARIEAIRKSAVNQVLSLAAKGEISSNESLARQGIISRAFEMQAFPWMTKKVQEYWSKAYAYKRYLPDTVYYGLPYIQTGPSQGYVNRRYNAEKAISENRYTATGKGYYLLNQDKLLDGMYCGNDCSAFASIAQFGINHSASFLNTTGIAKSNFYKSFTDYKELRPGDILVKSGDHVIVFLYYVDSFKTKMMIIEQGGDGSTVICSIYNASWFSSKGYIPRRQIGFAQN